MSERQVIPLCLAPLDAVFFRDGRPFDPAIRADSGLPHPQTLAGAMRTALLARNGVDLPDFYRQMKAERRRGGLLSVRDVLARCGAPDWILDAQFRGPWLAARWPDRPVMPFLPVPATLLRSRAGGDERSEWSRAEPLAEVDRPWLRPAPGLLPLWHRGDPDAKYPGGLLSLMGIRRFLEGGLPEDRDWFEPRSLYGVEARTGIELDMDTLTSAKGRLYTLQTLALRPHIEQPGLLEGASVCLYAELLTSAEVSDLGQHLSAPFPFGGEGHYVAVDIPNQGADWPPLRRDASRSVWLLATPGIFSNEAMASERPDAIPTNQLRAMACRDPLPVSGWDVPAGGPRPTRFAVPAGSVYYVEGPFCPEPPSLCGRHEDIAEGWGFALQGAWNHE